MSAPKPQLPPIVCLMGPTAAGKTDLAIALVENLPFEIISVDSVMIYQGMDIGSAKPDTATLSRAPHRLIDILDPVEAYSAARFRDDARVEIEAIREAGRIPLLVGGTMLYYRALLYGLSSLPSADDVTRSKLETEAKELGWAAMHERLRSVDSEAAARIHPNDPQRIQRALEVYEISGIPMSVMQKQTSNQVELPYRVIKLAVGPEDRAVLHSRIAERFQLMLKQGFIEEVEELKARGDLNLNMPSIRAVGYRQVWEYLDGAMDYTEMEERGVIATRQLAKRQMTWLRSEPNVRHFDSMDRNLFSMALKWVDQALSQSH